MRRGGLVVALAERGQRMAEAVQGRGPIGESPGARAHFERGVVGSDGGFRAGDGLFECLRRRARGRRSSGSAPIPKARARASLGERGAKGENGLVDAGGIILTLAEFQERRPRLLTVFVPVARRAAVAREFGEHG